MKIRVLAQKIASIFGKLVAPVEHRHLFGIPYSNHTGVPTKDGGYTTVMVVACSRYLEGRVNVKQDCKAVGITKCNLELCADGVQQRLLNLWRNAGYEPVLI